MLDMQRDVRMRTTDVLRALNLSAQEVCAHLWLCASSAWIEAGYLNDELVPVKAKGFDPLQ